MLLVSTCNLGSPTACMTSETSLALLAMHRSVCSEANSFLNSFFYDHVRSVVTWQKHSSARASSYISGGK